MDFQQARDIGYYFDRCIDLEFYDDEKTLIGRLITPKHGMKPTITIKGLFIEGGYAIDSYISIQNMAFDVDVAYVSYIKARMYYSGLEETSIATNINQRLKHGHTILYRVLYADQEKEPPNRCIRFQCVVASKDTTMYETPMYVSGGSVEYLKEGQDANKLVSVLENKSNSKAPLKKICEELIRVYNAGLQENGDKRNSEFYNCLKISILEIDEPLEELNVQLSSGEYSLGDFIRLLNSNATETDINGFSYYRFKIVIDRGSMRVSTPIPSNWKQVARSEGYTKEKYQEFYDERYGSVKTKTYSIENGKLTNEKDSPVIPLNFVKSATRSECIIYVETLFDDRITPGCHVSIKSNSIMGKKFGTTKTGRKGSRIIHYLDRDIPVFFRNTGKIEYLFSTTEDSYMKLQGPVDNSIAKAWNEEAKAERLRYLEEYNKNHQGE